MENNVMTPKAVAKEIVDRIQESVIEQDNPKNRIVTDIWVTENGSFKDIWIRSDCDSFAEKDIRVITTCNPNANTDYFKSAKWTLLHACVGDTEESVITDIRAMTSSMKEAEYAACSIYRGDDKDGTLPLLLEDYITRLVKKKLEKESFIEFSAGLDHFRIDVEHFLNGDDNKYVAKLYYDKQHFGNLLIDLTK